MSVQPADARLLVLYDADCGICTRSARLLQRLDRDRRLRLVPLQEAGAIDGAPPLEALLEAIHVRDRHGAWYVAGAACGRIADEIPIARPLALVGRLPGVLPVVEWAYRRVAGNRHRLSRLMGDESCPILPRTP